MLVYWCDCVCITGYWLQYFYSDYLNLICVRFSSCFLLVFLYCFLYLHSFAILNRYYAFWANYSHATSFTSQSYITLCCRTSDSFLMMIWDCYWSWKTWLLIRFKKDFKTSLGNLIITSSCSRERIFCLFKVKDCGRDYRLTLVLLGLFLWWLNFLFSLNKVPSQELLRQGAVS